MGRVKETCGNCIHYRPDNQINRSKVKSSESGICKKFQHIIPVSIYDSCCENFEPRR